MSRTSRFRAKDEGRKSWAFTFDEEARVKKLITAVVVLCAAACSSSSSVTKTAPTPASGPVVSGNQTGAADPVLAIRGFLSAAKSQDIQALGALWGDAQGPARDRMERSEAEKRELIMACYLKHDRYDIVGDAPNPGGTRAIVTRRNRYRATSSGVSRR